MSTLRRACIVTLFVSAAANGVQPVKPPTDTKPAASPHSPVPTTDAKKLTAKERLDASAKLYAGAKNYRDEGTLKTEMNLPAQKGMPGQVITESKPFSTAFERGGRFRWEFYHSGMPGGKPDNRFTIWSADGESFNSFWTLTGQTSRGQELDMPLASATGISGGSAMAIVPMLKMSKKPGWGTMTTDLQEPADKGKEAVDGVECWKIAGTQNISDAKVTLWLDDAGLIRKIASEMVIDSSKFPGGKPAAVPPFTAVTTITIKPFINEAKVDDAKFAADPKDGSRPAK